jgi:hypothetical protein
VRRLLLTLTLLVSVALALVGSAGSADRGRLAAEPPPVPSLEPAKTAALWNQLVSTRASRTRATADCRPLRAVFYAASDWLRLATKLAATASPCAEYYISIPPLVADKTTFRRDQASRIRALGPNFHVMAEIHFTTWNRWVASTGSSWHAAGVTARQRMAEAGYEVALGDTWQLNELSTAVRRGEGNARTNIREFLRGLYEGDGSRPTKGAALIVGVGQRTSDLTVYQETLQNWLSDTAFWTDMSTYVSDWTQEVYGDVRSHAVPGVPTSTRREYLNDYLQHKHVLSGVAPETVEPARSYLREAYSALGNAAWQRDTGYGWTMVPPEQMAAYVSAQVNALRYYSAATGQSRDHWGFAWAPRNATGMPNADFGAQTNLILERMAAAIRDSGDVVEPENPGGGACGPPGSDTLCAADVADARHNEAWRTFRGWTQAVLGFGTAPQTVAAGVPSAAITLSLVTSTGAGVTSGPPRAVTVRSSSPQGTFSASPAGPWTPTLAVTVAAGAAVTFYYLDTRAGSHTLTASASGTTNGAQAVTVTAGPAAAVAVTPAAGEVRARGVRRFTARATDAFGNAAVATVTWTVTPAVLGTIAPGEGGTATFTARRLLRTGRVTATAGTISASATVTVTPAKLRIGSIALQPGARFLRVTVTTADGARRPVSGTAVRLVVKRDGRKLASARGVTGPAGKTRVRVPGGRGCFTVTVTRAVAQGFTWDGRTPRNRACRR